MAVSHKLKTIRTEEIEQFHRQTQAALLHAPPLLNMQLLGRDIGRRHAPPALYNPFASQVDLPRLVEGGVNIWTVRGLRDVADLPQITLRLFERGFSKEEVRLILRGNFLRVLRRVCG